MKLLTILILVLSSMTIGIGQIIDGHRIVCPGSVEIYCADLSGPGNSESVETIWEVEGGIITAWFSPDGDRVELNGGQRLTRLLKDCDNAAGNTLPICIEITWVSTESGIVKLRQNFDAINPNCTAVLPEDTETEHWSNANVEVAESLEGGLLTNETIVICDNSELIYLQGELGLADSHTWEYNSSQVTCVSECGSLAPTFMINNGVTEDVDIQFVLTGCNGELIEDFTTSIWVGPPTSSDISIPRIYSEYGCLEPLTSYNFCIEVSPGSDISWSVPNCHPSQRPRCWTIEGSGTNQCVNIITGVISGVIEVTVSNKCGSYTKGLGIPICNEDEGPEPNPDPHFAEFDGRSKNTSQSESLEANLYPVPTSNNLFIEFSEKPDVAKEIIVDIFNNSGMMVSRKNLLMTSDKFRYEINIHELNSGIYYLKIFDHGSELNISKKIVKL